MKLLEVISVVDSISTTTNQAFKVGAFRPINEEKSTGDKTVYCGAAANRVFNVGKEPQIGELFSGDIVTFKTTPYMIGERTVDKITIVAFSDENPQELANAQLKKHNASTIGTDGKPTAPTQVKKPKLEVGAGKKEEEEAVA